ncbi:MAG: amino acid ABC transporter ATP-binding protein [Clostridia bacterium]|nr:amino acid ABC transporter ATP-binding protein [Oscillospiraceae bacterium]MBQ7959965.1 amino acid ABC transporter ATP-binding protein [Clostridia bacterium]
MSVISAKNIKKSFGKLEVLKDVSLDVQEGEVVSIIGPSGSGKSTFLRSMIHLETVDGGSISIDGEEVVANGIYLKSNAFQKLGMVFQNFNLFPHKSVLENITLAPMLVNKETKDEAEGYARELLESVGLLDKIDAYPYQLSGGQQQRVAIARALAMRPRAILFDEPTSALDPELTGEILKVIRDLANRKMTMVIVTHEIEFAKIVSDRIIFMADGYIVEEGSPDAVVDNPQNERTKAFLKHFTR